MIDKPQVGEEFMYRPSRGAALRVRVTGFRGNWIETIGREDGQRRDVSRTRLEKVT